MTKSQKFGPDDTLIRRLAALLEETGLTDIEYEADGRRIRVGRNFAGAGAPPEPAPGEEAVPAGAMISPRVGTVYVATEPGGTPLVKVGDQVTEGQTLLIIEAMKVMNPLPSPRAGRVTSILIADGQPIEYGEPLLTIE
jgi:acetyl-CoA carboxylase biotin carboxyl carrier protein